MRRFRWDNNILVKALRNLVLILLFIVFISLVYNFRNRDSSTNVALMAEATASKSFRGVFIRSEEVITYSGNGVLSYNVADGGKVGNGTVIAAAYTSNEQIGMNSEIARLEKKLDILKKIQNPGTIESAQPAALSEDIEENYRTLIYARDMKDYASVRSDMDNLLIQMSTYQIITNEVNSFNQQIVDIMTELNEMQAESVKPAEIITSSRPAYFVSYSDGYEDTLTPDRLGTITAEELKAVTDKKSHDPKVVGKLMDGYGWYLAGVVDNSKREYSAGDYVKLRFDSAADTFSAEIVDIRSNGDPSESIFIIQCSQFNYDLVQHRAENVEIIKGDYKGLKVPREAIRFADVEVTETDEETGEQIAKTVNTKGVYIIKGEQITFRIIDVIYEGSDYVLSAVHDNDSSYLALYDDIMIEGVDADDQ